MAVCVAANVCLRSHFVDIFDKTATKWPTTIANWAKISAAKVQDERVTTCKT